MAKDLNYNSVNSMDMNRVLLASLAVAVLAGIQVYIGLNMHEFGVGGLHLHITLAVILLGLAHLPFLRSEGLLKKVFMLVIVLVTLQGVVGLYLAFVEAVRGLQLIHHIIGWLVLFTSLGGAALAVKTGFSS